MIAPSRRALLAGAAGVALAGALGGGAWYWHGAEQSRERAAYAEALARVRLAQSAPAKPAERAAAIAGLEATLARYPFSPAAAQAAYELAGIRFDAREYAAARRAYEIVLARGAPATLTTLARAGIGYAWEGEGNPAKASEAFQSALSATSPKDFYYETLLLDLGRSQELAGRRAEAIATYRRLLQEFPQARRAPDVRARLLDLGAG